jgi:hypothetical protein
MSLRTEIVTYDNQFLEDVAADRGVYDKQFIKDFPKLEQAAQVHGYRGASKKKHNGIVPIRPADIGLFKTLEKLSKEKNWEDKQNQLPVTSPRTEARASHSKYGGSKIILERDLYIMAYGLYNEWLEFDGLSLGLMP